MFIEERTLSSRLGACAVACGGVASLPCPSSAPHLSWAACAQETASLSPLPPPLQECVPRGVAYALGAASLPFPSLAPCLSLVACAHGMAS